jgi:hypothetical protein
MIGTAEEDEGLACHSGCEAQDTADNDEMVATLVDGERGAFEAGQA